MSNMTLFFTVFTFFVLGEKTKNKKKTPIGWYQHAVKTLTKDVCPPRADRTKAREQAELLTVVIVAAAWLTGPPGEIKERKKKEKEKANMVNGNDSVWQFSRRLSALLPAPDNGIVRQTPAENDDKVLLSIKVHSFRICHYYGKNNNNNSSCRERSVVQRFITIRETARVL